MLLALCIVTVVMDLSCRKKLKKGVLLYVHVNLSAALLLALVIFVGGIETAKSVPVSVLRNNIYVLHV